MLKSIEHLNETYLHVIIALIGFCCLTSCCDSARLRADLKRLQSAPITLPIDVLTTFEGRDSVIQSDLSGDMKLVIYTDSVGCTSCAINKMHLWNRFLDYAKSFDGRLKFYFIFAPSKHSEKSVRVSLATYKFQHPVLIDTKFEFERLNPHLPKNKQLHAFLLDKDNNVVLVGNPLTNQEVEKLFYKTTQNLLKGL